jgi:hypothetical protein
VHLKFNDGNISSGVIKILRADGKEILSKEFNLEADQRTLEIETAMLPKGIYLIMMLANENTFTRKIVLE